MIQLTSSSGTPCQRCRASITRATLRYADPVAVEHASPKVEYYHLACALQAMPLKVESALASFEGVVPDRAAIDRVIALWREVFANPDDDGPRLVLADLLQGQGDPRGELMALQLLHAEDHARIDALIATHADRWIGRLRGIALAMQFRRGCLARLELANTQLGPFRHDPILGTVEDLLQGTARPDRYARYVQAMTGLRRIEVWDDDTLEAFERTDAPIVHVGCAFPTLGLGEGLAELGARFLRACTKHTALTSLALQVQAFDAVARSPILGRLSAITLVGRLRETLPIWQQLPRSMTVTITSSAKLPPLHEPPFGDLELRHGNSGVTARASGQWVRDGLVANLPASVTRLEIVGAPEDLAGKLWESARARRLDLVFAQAPASSGIWRPA